MQITNHHHIHHHHQHFNVQGNGNAGPEVAQLKEIIMALTAEVQRALDLARQNRTLSGSVDEGVKALRIQLADLQEKLDAVPVAPAKAMSQEDKDALIEIGDDLDNSVSTLKADIPANVPAAGTLNPPAGAPSGSLLGASQTPNPTTPAVDPAQQQADAAAASAAKPIAGTGVSDGNPAPTASAAGQPVTPAGETLPDPANPSTTNVVTPPTDGGQPTTPGA